MEIRSWGRTGQSFLDLEGDNKFLPIYIGEGDIVGPTFRTTIVRAFQKAGFQTMTAPRFLQADP